MNFDHRKRVSWHQLMFHIKWWVFVMRMKSCFLMYNTFECHFKPLRLSKTDMRHPVWVTSGGEILNKTFDLPMVIASTSLALASISLALITSGVVTTVAFTLCLGALLGITKHSQSKKIIPMQIDVVITHLGTPNLKCKQLAQSDHFLKWIRRIKLWSNFFC